LLSSVGKKYKPREGMGMDGCQAGGPFGDALIHEALDALHLHARDDCADIDGLIERGPMRSVFMRF